MNTAHIVPWKDVAVRIYELLEEGNFATNLEIAEAPSFERHNIADYLCYSVMRMIDTGVGVACALFVNWYFTRPRVEHILTKLHIPHNADGSVFVFKSKDEADDEAESA